MPEFYTIFARKKYFTGFFWEGQMRPCSPSPTPMVLVVCTDHRCMGRSAVETVDSGKRCWIIIDSTGMPGSTTRRKRRRLIWVTPLLGRRVRKIRGTPSLD